METKVKKGKLVFCIKFNIDSMKQVEMTQTTICPTCGKEWTRSIFIPYIPECPACRKNKRRRET